MRRKQEPIPFPTGTFLDVLPRRPPLPRPRIPWHDLLRRTFGIDVLRCRNCNGSMRVLAVIQQSSVSRKILRHLGLPDAPPEVARSRAPPQLAFAH